MYFFRCCSFYFLLWGSAAILFDSTIFGALQLATRILSWILLEWFGCRLVVLIFGTKRSSCRGWHVGYHVANLKATSANVADS